MTEWVVIPGWKKFQHYQDRRPPWIKDYVELVDRDEYLELSPTARALLQDLRRMYALTDGVVRRDAVATRVRMRLKRAHWKELSDAGFIEIVASKPLALRYKLARPEVETETEKKSIKKSPKKRRPEKVKTKARAWIDHTVHELDNVDLERVIGDEFEIEDPELLGDLVAYATERMKTL